jgi:hypothetical protein
METYMDSEMIIAMAGLTALGAAAFTGAIWDSPLVSPRPRKRRGRHAMPAGMAATARKTA